MASNESFATSPMAAGAECVALEELHRYPDPLADDLRARLTRLTGAPMEQILVGSGSDELMLLLTIAYAAGGGTVVCAEPGYWGHEYPARIAGATVKKIPLVSWVHDLDAMGAVDADVTFVCNPHNPTGTTVSKAALERFTAAARARVVVVDEAYIEFSDTPQDATVVDLAINGRLVVLRTMSKYYGLAGLRVGYLVGPSDVVSTLTRIRLPFSVNAVAQAAALAALDDEDHQLGVRARTLANRAALAQAFVAAGFEVVPSQANFILVLANDEHALLRRLEAHGVVARPGSQLGIPGSVRVTVPSEEGLSMVRRALRANTFPAS